MKRIRQAIENLASAVAYAEEGRREDALALIDALRPIRASSHAKVILASSGPTFSDSSLTYMQGLMERMPCDILALTTEAKLKKEPFACTGHFRASCARRFRTIASW
jgi:hypothetical protein